MKSTVKAVVLFTLSFTLFGAMPAHAQTYPVPHFEHVIIVIQENRTPDNLFGAAATIPYPSTLPPLNTSKYDLQLPPAQTPGGGGTPAPISSCLGTCFDPNHSNGAWQLQDGLFNGQGYNACASGNGGIGISCPQTAQGGCTAKDGVCFQCGGQYWVPPGCPQETYVDPMYDYNQASFGGIVPIYPYFDIAAKYGFANYFFQTNQGPSQPAHDFLFGGTSAPSGSSQDAWYGTNYNDFAADNPMSGTNTTDCDYTTGLGVNPAKQMVPFVFPDGHQTDGGGVNEYPCFDHLTLVDLLNNATPQLSWKYYARSYSDYWTAPAGIAHLCYGPGWMSGDFPWACQTPPPPGTYTGFTSNVVVPSETFFKDVIEGGTGINAPPPPGQGQGAPLCALPNVTWIIPNGGWSDHPGPSGTASSTTTELGPDWVANIINAVGNATCVEANGQSPWLDTVIFVVWDDWGGFYDHIGAGLGANKACNTWGCGYTYGFRVPFLVVSQYTSPGYVSGACVTLENCPNNVAPYQHDFGSILAFIENNFNLGIGSINSADCPVGQVNVDCFLFADAHYPERNAGSQYLPLGDFFNLWYGSENSICTNPDGCPLPFTSITLASGMCGNVFCYGVQYFENGGDGRDTDPDNDAIDND